MLKATENRIVQIILASSILVSTWLMLKYYWVCDDAFISFRFAKNFALGEGLRYNLANEIPVEGYSNLLWVFLAAFFEFFGIPSYQVVPYFSIPCALLLVWKVYRAGIDYFELPVLISGLAAAGLALFPPIIIWGTSGLEPAPFALLTFLVFEQLFLKSDSQPVKLAIYGLLLCLIRVEGPLWALTFSAMAFMFMPERRKIALKFAAYILLIIAGHTAFRYYYYQEFLPNTASTKVAFSVDRLERGFNYVLAFALTFVTPFFALLALLFKPTRIVFLSCLVFIGFYAYSVLSGGDYMTMGRFLIPAAAFQMLLIAVVLQKLTRTNQMLPLMIMLTLIVIAFLPLYERHLVPHAIRAKFHFRFNTNKFWNEMQQWAFMKENARRWRHKGELLKSYSKPGDSLVEGTIGAVGYFSDLYIYDRLGLVSKLGPEFTRPKMRSAGHDKKAPLNYFLPHKPTYSYANLDRLDRFRRTGELKNRFPYAPFVYPSGFEHEKDYVFLVFKRVATKAEFDQQWAKLRELVDSK